LAGKIGFLYATSGMRCIPGSCYKNNNKFMEGLMTRVCQTCGEEKALDEFHYNGHGYSKNCKACIKKKSKRYFVFNDYNYQNQEESYYLKLLKKTYPQTWVEIVIKIKRGEY
jgi:hypothetical protein